jgi:uncharacterized protein YceH (UPF0502 family)
MTTDGAMADGADWTPVRTLESGPRRVLGALLEKGFTTPDQYPLTIKSATTACNQKCNREPTTNYSEDDVEGYLIELQELGLVAELHTDGGRALRYRHLIRKRYDFTEPQLAILTELWLRGRQQPGELRTRASRMVPIESQEALRAELTALQAAGWIRSSGPLDRRGVEVDHTFYTPREGATTWSAPSADEETGMRAPLSSTIRPVASAESTGREQSPSLQERVTRLEQRLAEVEDQLRAVLG